MNEEKKLDIIDRLKGFTKQQKEFAVANSSRGDIPPTIIVEKQGEIQCIVISPQIDKQLGLQAASMCQAGFDPDALTLICDAHIHTGKMKEGQTLEEAHEEFKNKYPPGSMQKKCDEEGACETGEITDCLICHRITRDGDISLITLPYSYHGKDGPPFKWIEDKKFEVDTTKEGLHLQGFIPESLRKIMKTPALQSHPEFQKLVENFKDFTPERSQFHTSRAIMSLMTSQKFLVFDFTSGSHPEWIDAKGVGLSLLDKMLKDGFFPSEAKEPIKELIENYMGKIEFKAKFNELLNTHPYWLPTPHKEINSFVMEFESICFSPQPPYCDEDENNEEDANQSKVKKRVRVWNGDQSEYLGEGYYVGNATIYVIQMPDGSIQSLPNAEIEPTQIPEGGVVRKIPSNPKIVLDNGDVVYGAQTWWEEIDGKSDDNNVSDSDESDWSGSNHNPVK